MSDNNQNQPKKVVRKKAVTPEEKAHQRSLGKIKRLNAKLSRVKQITQHIEQVAAKGKPVSAQQVQAWVKHLNSILNVNDDKDE